MAENWKPIDGYEDAYEISDLGRVRSLPREVAYGQHVRKIRLTYLRFYRGQRGEVRVQLHMEGRKTAFNVAALVLAAFVGPRPPEHDARHVDLDQENNTLANLFWGPPANSIMISWGQLKHG